MLGTHPFYAALKQKAGGGILGNDIKWNFGKFLIDRQVRRQSLVYLLLSTVTSASHLLMTCVGLLDRAT